MTRVTTKKMKKDTVIKYVLFLILVLVLPIIAYFVLNYFYPLDPILYAITALTGYYTLCLSTSLKIWGEKKDTQAIITILLLLLFFPLAGYYLFNIMVPLNSIIFAGVGFGAYFGVCMNVGFKLLLSKNGGEKMNEKSIGNSIIKREIREMVTPISVEGIIASTNSIGYNGHVKATEFNNEDRPDEFTPSTVIISGGYGTWDLNVPKEILKDLIDMTLKIETVRTHGMLHSPERGKIAKIFVNNKPVDKIKLVKEHPHGEDYGVDSRRPIPIFRFIDRANETQTIKIEVDNNALWDIDYITLEPIIKRMEWKPGAILVIGAIISAFFGVIASFIINLF